MAIRFRCSSCTQPIEIDDQWASKAVACPYCRKTISAPAESTLEALEEIPEARGLSAAPDPTPVQLQTPVPPTPLQNRLAAVAFGLAVGAVVFVAGSFAVRSAHPLEYDEFTKVILESTNFNEQMQAQVEFFEENPNAYSWMIPMWVMYMTAVVLSVAALICGIIALRRPVGKGFAGAACGISAFVMIFSCCGGLMM